MELLPCYVEKATGDTVLRGIYFVYIRLFTPTEGEGRGIGCQSLHWETVIV